MTTMRSANSYFLESERNQPYFLDSCFLCRKQLSHKSDIYMYRGDMPFCTQECRQEQIEMDEANEKRLKMSKRSSSKAVRQQNKDSNKESDANKAVRTGTVAVA